MSLAAVHARRLAAASALVLMAGAGVGLAGPAQADPQSQSQGQHDGKGKAKGKHRGHDDRGDRGGRGGRGGNGHGPRGNNGNHGHGNNGNHGHGSNGHGNGNGGGNSGGQGNGSNGSGGHSQGGGSGDPAGNNGTVKIAPLGAFDGIPNNTPHPGCTFLVEWYGFDEGADVVSTVSFAMHAPTSDVGLTVDGPPTVFVGEDPASGAGTDSGLDARQAYTLSFDGEPHPKQGYHVKLTVNTPRSQGADKKSKVFWVEPCEAGSATPSDDDEDTTGSGDEGDEGTEGTGGAGGTSAEGDDTSTTDQGVMGEAQGPGATGDDAGTTGSTGSAGSAGGDSAVPTSVDAGDGGNPVVDAFTSPWGLASIVLGLLTAAGAFLLRRRTTA